MTMHFEKETKSNDDGFWAEFWIGARHGPTDFETLDIIDI